MTTSKKENLVSCKEQDFLENDPPIRGQSYCCISFLSPEDVIKRKEAYFFETYIKNFSEQMNEFFARMEEKYPNEKDTFFQIKDRFHHVFDFNGINDDYTNYYNLHSEELEKAYYEANDFQTSIRGVKIRGVFDSVAGAKNRCKVIKAIDGTFHVYVAEMGAWCPWSPNPDDIEDQEHAETQLNTLTKNYKENISMRNEFYEKRKRELIDIKKNKNSVGNENNNVSIEDSLQKNDAWTEKNIGISTEQSQSLKPIDTDKAEQPKQSPESIETINNDESIKSIDNND